jgi:propanol-preferring alcohol dehydrogenase
MRGVLLPGNRRVALSDFADPSPAFGQVVVRMKAAAICGTDLHLYRARPEDRRPSPDIIPGHEPSGVVETVGAGVTQVKPGDRVTVYHYLGCGRCAHCRLGNIMWCSERRGYGGPVHGSDADLLLTDERNCLLLPPALSFVDGALIACPASTAFSALRKLGALGGETLVIFGLGPVGLCGTLIGRALGARVIGVEPSAVRRSLAEDIGAEATLDPERDDVVQAIRGLTHEAGASAIFETSGQAAAHAAALQAAALGGRAAFVGFGAKGKTMAPADFIGKQLMLMGSFVSNIATYWELSQLLIDREIRLEQIVTHRFSLDEAPEAFRLFDSGRTGKVVFEWE